MVSPKIVESLIADPSRMSLEGERRVLTFLFTDLANFTTLSEALDPHALSRLVNEYFDGVTEIVLKYDGTISKFEGDAVFAIFNAPVDQPDHAQRAVRCALELDRYAEAFRTDQVAKGGPYDHFGVTRIGIHTGEAVVGNFGSRKRFYYSAMGDAVNTAARLEGVNKQFGTHMCVSEATRALCPGTEFRPLSSVVVKGKAKGIGVFEPLHEDHGHKDYLARYGAAFAKLASEAPEARDLFAALNRENPADRCVVLHLSRLESGEHGAELVLTEK
jgi:class 3 adenylate cyclase